MLKDQFTELNDLHEFISSLIMFARNYCLPDIDENDMQDNSFDNSTEDDLTIWSTDSANDELQDDWSFGDDSHLSIFGNTCQ